MRIHDYFLSCICQQTSVVPGLLARLLENLARTRSRFVFLLLSRIFEGLRLKLQGAIVSMLIFMLRDLAQEDQIFIHVAVLLFVFLFSTF